VTTTEAPPEGSRQPDRRRLPSFKQAHVAIAALLGLATGAIALLFQLVPALKPDPRDRIGADLAIVALEPGVPLGRWIERAFPPSEHAELAKQYPNARARGEMLYVTINVDGHKHRNVSVRYGVYDAKTERRVRLDAPPNGPSDSLALSAPSERSVQVLWIPDLSLEPALFVRVELWDDNGILAVADSPRIVRGRFPK
jgi:hypothetical protein